MLRKVTIPIIIALFFSVGFFITERQSDNNELSRHEQKLLAEKVKYEKFRKHFSQSSPEHLRYSEKIEKIERRLEGYAKSDKPEEFARILAEMKTKPGENSPSYPANYRVKEFNKSRAAINKRTSGDPLPWVSRGPGNVSGRVRGIVIDPADTTNNTWFVGSVGGGIWKTTDAGSTWQELATNLPVFSTSAIVMAPSNTDVLYVGTGESFFNVDVINGNGILKSTDRGNTWFQLQSTAENPQFNNISRLLVDPNDENIILASTTTGRYKLNQSNFSGIFKSTDGGDTWTNVYTETETVNARVKKVLHIIADPNDFNIMYAGIEDKGIYKSTDAGDTWFNSSTGMNDRVGRFELAIFPANTSRIYAASEGSSFSNLYVSTDAGATWNQTTENGSEPNWLGSQGWYDNTIVAHPTNENIVYVGGVYLFKITLLANNKRNTTEMNTGPVHVDHHNLVILNETDGGFRILNANDGGLGLSGNGDVNWTKPTDGLVTTQFYGVDKKPGASAYVGGMQDNGTWRSPENSDTNSDWFYQIGGDGYETSWHFDDPLKIIGGYQFNGLMRSTDGGNNWQSATSGLSDEGSGSAPFITKIAKSNLEPDLLFAVGSQGVWKSTNFGASWMSRPITSNWMGSSSFTDVKISRADPDIVWAGSRMDSFAKIFVSTDRGETFTPSTVYSDVQMGGISGISTHPHDAETAYVLFSYAQSPKILKTTDLGQSWTDISGFGTNSVSSNGFPDVAVYDLLVMPHTPDTIWAATEIGLYESTDDGATWAYADNGLPAYPIWMMTHVEEEVVLATHGRGVWSVNIPGLSSGVTYKPLIKSLTQNLDGLLEINVALRSLYDSSHVVINDEMYESVLANLSPVDTIFSVPVTEEGEITAYVVAYKDGNAYQSVIQSVDVIPLLEASETYTSNLDDAADEFISSGITVKSQNGFEGMALHSPHDYGNNNNYTAMLRVPIIVKATDAYLKYEDIAIIEPGDPGTVFGDQSFWDYVVVEGTKDGMNWVPLEDGYDCRYNSTWSSAYSGGQNGAPSMYVSHEINLLDTFEAGDKILIRFRLFADAFVTGWGWAIDNIQIQGVLSDVDNIDSELPTDYSLSQNYPNPFNPATTINFGLPSDSRVSLKVYDTIGQEVATIVNSSLKAGYHTYNWDASRLSSGVYIYRIEAENFVQSRKMILIK
ncbi:MAG: glycosyl hydrolase [Melioribacteraceae bacterium]|nr:MAG: glycosyl hydrolase [Melioribacteraceae bacterium]